MEQKIVWLQGSNNPENPNYLASIREWWVNLNGKEITLAQRIALQSEELDKLNWEPQRFDEVFVIERPELRGITLYWHKPDFSQERNTTPRKLILDYLHQCLYIFPQSQKELVMRVGWRSISYQTISMLNPDYSHKKLDSNYILYFKDATQTIEVKITLSVENLKQMLLELTK